MHIALRTVECIEDARGQGSDEPYAIVFAVDAAAIANLIAALSGGVAGLARTTLYGPLGGMTAGDTKRIDSPALCWGFDDRPRTINAPLHPLLLVAVMESDHPDEFANAVRAITHGKMIGALLSSIGQARSSLVQNLISNMESALDTAKKMGLERDERLGPVLELQLTQADLDAARNTVVEKSLTFVSEEQEPGEGDQIFRPVKRSEYKVTFRMSSFLSVRFAANSCGISAPFSWIQAISGNSVRDRLLAMERTCLP